MSKKEAKDNKTVKPPPPGPSPQTSVEEDQNSRRMVPMTKEEWEKQQGRYSDFET